MMSPADRFTYYAVAPSVTMQPTNQTAQNGTATFTAAANGGLTPSVQWMVSTNGGVSFSNTTDEVFTAAAPPVR